MDERYDKKEKERNFWEGVKWVRLNMFMPLLPMLIRLAIVLFSVSKGVGLEIVDLPELIYYTIFMCVLCFSMFEGQSNCMEMVFGYILQAVIVVCLIIIFLYYYKDLRGWVTWLAIIVTILVTICTLVYKFRVCGKEEA